MRILLLVPLLFLFACGDEGNWQWTWACKPDTQEKREKFILQCVDKANPHSDEEPEDWIDECGRQAKLLYCEWAKVRHRKIESGNWKIQKEDTVLDP